MTLSRNVQNCSNIRVECAVFTKLKQSVSEADGSVVCICYYSAWAYSLFAFVGLILIFLPLVLLLCCILRRRAKHRHYITSSNTEYSREDESPFQPLVDDSELFANYGAIESDQNRKENSRNERNQLRESESNTSSRASLLPNYDETSLNFRNALLARKPSTSDSSKLKPKALTSVNEKTKVNSSQLPQQSGLYATVDLVPDSSTVSRSDYNRQYSENEQPIYNVLEHVIPDDTTVEASSTGISEQLDKAYPYRTKGEDNSSKIDDSLNPNSYLLDGPSLGADNGVQNEQIFDEEKTPHYGVLEPENQNITDKTENKSNADRSVSKLSEYKPDVRSDSNPYDSSVKCNLSPEQAETRLSSTNEEDQNDKCEKVPSAHLTNETDSRIQIDLQYEEPRKRLESRSDYETFLVDEVKKLPEDQRQGCYLIRDSLTAPGCKVLTMYAVNVDSKQKLYNFKVCFDKNGSVYLAKSKRMFQTIEELLSHLEANKDMLPCTLTRQLFIGEEDSVYEEVVA